MKCLTVRMRASKQVGFRFSDAPAVRGAVGGRREFEPKLSMEEGENVVNPSDQEKTIREAGFDVGDGVKGGPINGVKLCRVPVVDAAHMLDLRLLVGVGKRGSADVADLSRELVGDGPLLDR